MNITSIQNKLQEIVGKQSSVELVDLKLYARDGSQVEGMTELVLWPNNMEQARKVIRLCCLRGYQLTLRGAGSGSAGGAVPQHSIVLDMSRFNRIIELDRNEKSIVIEAGVHPSALNTTLAQLKLWFPLTPWERDVCTFGGMMAMNTPGPYIHRYGTLKDWVFWFDIIDGSGKEIRTTNLENFIGAEGTTGAIVRMKLKLMQIMESTSATIWEYSSVDEILRALPTLQDNPNIIAIEYIDKTTAKLLQLNEAHMVLLEFQDSSGEIQDQETIAHIWQKFDATIPLWTARKYTHVVRLLIPKAAIHEYLRWTRKHTIPTIGSLSKSSFTSLLKDQRIIQEHYSFIRSLKGAIITIGQLHKTWRTEKEIEEYKALKRQFDPSFILNKANL